MALPFLTAIIPAITSAITAVTTALTSLGPTITAYATKVAPTLVKIARNSPPILKNIVEVANTVSSTLNILRKGETIENIGERSLQAAETGITLEKFDSVNEYIKELRSFNLDLKESESRDPIIPIVAGLAITTLGLEHKFQLKPGNLEGLWLLAVGNNSNYLTADRIDSLLRSNLLNKNLFDYLNKNLSASDSFDFEKNLSKDMSKNEESSLYQALDEITSKITEINKTTE